jgi:hypothetical protein
MLISILFLIKTHHMKKTIPFLLIAGIIILPACSHRNYANSFFYQQTLNHRTIAVLPAEMIFTGKQSKDVTEDDIKKIEEDESRVFQMSLYSSILRYANYGKYYMFVNVQDINKTLNTLNENQISIRDSWKMDDKKLTELLGVDAVVRMQVTKKRYMSDKASYGVTVGRSIMSEIPGANRVPLPYNLGKTEDITAYCSVVSNNVTLWNNYYRGSADWNNPSNLIIDNITGNFGRNFPYKRRY